ncbi:hypothetical protein BDN72DRAFT_897013 [Pluteus cervinus]|uniref:Uncharacterized protein n=1 Tax=Pluteus cervinus TaxID=181527 RepID=A0ACD3AVR5_9AGAR|nr:hypothetical protein BDN72DRAFT_897013 [Pluteus cervinus]
MPKEKAVRHCRRCPNSPALSQCSHSVAGRAYLASLLPPIQDEGDSDRESNSSVDRLLSVSRPDELRLLATPVPDSSATDPVLIADRIERQRVRAGRPLYGHVEGCMRGKHALNVLRTKPLHAPEPDVRKATKRYNREMNAIISRCERISVETGCWLLIGAHHANANTPAIHYTSPKLRLEARDQVSDLTTKFWRLTSSLINARRVEAVALQNEVDSLKEQATTTAGELEQERAQTASLRAMLSTLGVNVV